MVGGEWMEGGAPKGLVPSVAGRNKIQEGYIGNSLNESIRKGRND